MHCQSKFKARDSGMAGKINFPAMPLIIVVWFPYNGSDTISNALNHPFVIMIRYTTDAIWVLLLCSLIWNDDYKRFRLLVANTVENVLMCQCLEIWRGVVSYHLDERCFPGIIATTASVMESTLSLHSFCCSVSVKSSDEETRFLNRDFINLCDLKHS